MNPYRSRPYSPAPAAPLDAPPSLFRRYLRSIDKRHLCVFAAGPYVVVRLLATEERATLHDVVAWTVCALAWVALCLVFMVFQSEPWQTWRRAKAAESWEKRLRSAPASRR